ncbi:hypothetical protein MRX96_024640 [Rhipicephalus microplus]
MSQFKTFSTTSYYGDDYLFTRAAVCTLAVGIVTLAVLLVGSVMSAQGRAALSKSAASGGFGGGLLHGVATDVSTTSHLTTKPLLRNATKTVPASRSTRTPKTTPANGHADEAVEVGLVTRLLRESLDDSADPCHDLRAHVCTGYDRGELGGQPLVERAAQDVADAVEAFFRTAISSSSALVAKHSSLRKAAALYRSCMDADPESPCERKSALVFLRTQRPAPVVGQGRRRLHRDTRLLGQGGRAAPALRPQAVLRAAGGRIPRPWTPLRPSRS